VVTRLVLTAALAVSLGGCIVRATRARDATLPYHPTLDELRVTTRSSAAARSLPIRIGRIRGSYPQPVGLDYSHDGAFRKVVAVEWSDGAFEAALDRRLRAWARDDGPARLDGGLISLAIYRFGGTVYASALLEARVIAGGDEVYAARYRATGHGPDRAALLEHLADVLAGEVAGDPGLVAAAGGRP
jgi:hypothetical protein